MALTVLFAVLAAFCNALGSVLQRKGTRSQPFEEAMSVRLLWRLVHQLPWLGGIVFMLGGFGLQVAALSTGPISLVQPVLVAEMGLTLVLSAMLLGSSMHTREWTAVFGMNTGIALLLVALRPTGGDTRGVTGPTWALGCLVTLAVIVGTVVLAHRYRYAHRAAYLGIAAGMFFGFIAVLVSGVTGAFAGGPKAVLSAWQTYALIVAGPTGFFLLQVTLRAGALVASQPGLTLANPLVGIGWGVAVFGEDVRGGGWIALEVLGFSLIAACTLLLARSASLRGSAGAYEETEGRADGEDAGNTGESGFLEVAEDAEDTAVESGVDTDASSDRNQENH